MTTTGGPQLTQRRTLVTEIPGPVSKEKLERKRQYVADGVGTGLPVFVTAAGGGVIQDADGNTLSLPILNEENGETEVVDIWGVRVPEAVYDGVAADKRDDGIIQANEVGRKSDGFLEVEYSMPVLGGAVTRW